MEPNSLKILMVSRDRGILSPDSPVRERMKEYGKLVTELHIVLLTRKEENLKSEELDKNIKVYPTNSASKFLYVHDAAKIGKKVVLDNKFVRGQSVITVQDPYECGWAGLKVKKHWRLPLEVQLHGGDVLNEHFTNLLDRFRNIIAKKVLKNADTIRVVHDALKMDVVKAFGVDEKRVSVLPIYIDAESIKNSKISFDLHARFGWQFIMLSVARLSVEKNLPLALEILSKIRERFPSVGLVVAGTGPELANLEALAHKLGVEKNVAFVGWQSDLSSYYRTANVFLQTSVYEGYGMALVEAGLSGLPVVTTPVGIAQSLTNYKDAYICPPGNVEYFSEAIIDLIENNQKRENLKTNLRQVLEAILVSKEDYLKKLRENWHNVSLMIK